MIVEGPLGTAGVLGGSVFGWRFEFLPVEVTLASRAITDALEEAKTNFPESGWTPRVVVRDTTLGEDYEMPEVLDISITKESEAEQESYSVTLGSSEKYSPRNSTYPDLLRSGRTDRTVKIYFDTELDGVTKTVWAFTGTLRTAQFPYPRGNASIAGSNLAENLTKADGTIENFTGSRANLITTLLKRAGITSVYLAIPDAFISEAQTLVSNSVAGTLATIFEAIPGVEYYVDVTGAFVTRAAASAQAMTYHTAKNISSFIDEADTDDIVTVVNVVGGTDDASLEYTDASGRATTYGRRVGTLSNSVLLTAAEAEAAAQAMIDESFRKASWLTVSALVANPLLIPGTVLGFEDPSSGGCGSGITSGEMTVRTMSLTWDAVNRLGTQSFSGEVET